MEYSDPKELDGSRFATVLQNLKRDNVPSLASRVRQSGHPSTGIIDQPTTSQPSSCELLPQITCGSFNAIFKIKFTDGTRWILKVPAIGHQQCWDAPASEALTSEALTMRLIKCETTIPVPEVFAFDASLENELRCPFILMEHVRGKALHGVWWSQSVSQARREQFRVRSLHDIAEAMTQLNALTFHQGGSLLFDDEGNVSGMRSLNMLDLETQYAKLRSPDYDDSLAFCQIGPFSDPKSHLLSLLGTNEGNSERSTVMQGACKLLRLFIEWSIMRTENGREKPFVLAHPDLDSQNIFVDDDGSLTGIIDFDWIAAVPHCIGPQSLPKFLTEDFDPDNYDYDVGAGEPKAGCLANSPEELACYRAMYAQFMESYLSENDRTAMAKNPRHARRIRMSRKDAANLTRKSLVTTTLQLAAKAPSEMQGLMKHLFEEIEKLTVAKWPDMPATADSREPNDSEEGGDGDEDTGASEVKTSDVADEKPCVGSSGSEGAALNIECLPIEELMDKIEQLTRASEVKTTDNVEETSCVGISGSDAAAINIESLSINELMDKIEELTGTLSASNLGTDIAQDTADLHASPAEEHFSEPGDEAHALNAKSSKKVARMPRAARVCGWVQKKLRRGAKYLHKRPEKDDAMARADFIFEARPVRGARTFCDWTEMQLRRVACCLHCNNDDNTDKVRIEDVIEAVRKGAIDVLEGLQTKLMQLTQKLHRKETNSSVASENSEDNASQNQNVTYAIKELTRAEIHSVCDKFLHMVQDKQLYLTADQQVAIAHWAIQMLKNPELSGMSSGTIDTHPQDENGDSEKDSGHGRGQKDGIASSDNGKDGDKEDEGIEQQNDEKKILEPVHRACIDQPSDLRQSEHGTDTAGTSSGQKEPTERSQSAVGQKTAEAKQKDSGAFNLFDVCIALSKGDLDQRRMKRLKDGFLGLLNQSL